MTLDEALAGGLIEVTEVSQGGAVPELKVVNKSPRMVLILDGEELVRAKQNRIVNTTILIQAKSTTVNSGKMRGAREMALPKPKLLQRGADHVAGAPGAAKLCYEVLVALGNHVDGLIWVHAGG
jgi:hypothetical protein